MTDSRPEQQKILLEQLAHALRDQCPDSEQIAQLKAMIVGAMGDARSWEDELQSLLADRFCSSLSAQYAEIYHGAFSSSYRVRFTADEAVADIRHIQSLADPTDALMRFYPADDQDSQRLRFKLYSQDRAVTLSDVVPMLENLGMRVLDEHPYLVQRQDGTRFGISDFTVELQNASIPPDQDAVQRLLQDAFGQVWRGAAESDEFNRLIPLGRLTWREAALIRGYSRYIKQLRFGFSQPFIAEVLARHLEIASLLVALFRARFEPDIPTPPRREALIERIENEILAALETVSSIDDDRILRRFYDLISATLRTNYFQLQDGQPKPYFSFKFDPRALRDIPEPRPRYEVFVYSPQVEGVHLRAGLVARGGLRWSDRLEDYRTEVLGLVKAQQVKNSVIVPVGAKGGFVVKQPPGNGSREEVLAAGIACYQTFIRGLLDLTDNLVEGRVVPPVDVVRHDDDDTYLVVAADKGTATFSDIANRLAAEYGFWLGDAFASGGSDGYDHKKMGITARGAWESVKRHFLEQGVDTQADEFSVVGIGDMSGDVFGNGMLLSDRIRLVGAFNHQHIFLDPNPDVDRAFAERQRLFTTPGSSWQDYDVGAISEGGGVFSRGLKTIPLSPQVRSVLAIEEERLAPQELIRALLQAPVDMIWNGGIGTYVKAPGENHEQAGDKANDSVRIDSSQLRCRVLGEGGNLGVTQLARIDFANAGGAVNSDFIDNAGGVDCSDHEVNIKILLNEQVALGRLSLAQRNQLLRNMAPEVAALVLQNNYRQALALAIASAGAATSVDEHARLIRYLESSSRLDRKLEFLPSDDELHDRRIRGSGLSRPELSVLISYTKLEIKRALLDHPIVQDDRFIDVLHSAFPPSLVAAFPEAMANHPLRAEIVATQLANTIVNRMGITWVDKVRHATRAEYGEVAAAYWIACQIYGIDDQWQAIEALDGRVASPVQFDLFRDLIRLVTRCTNWLLRNRPASLDPEACQQRYAGDLLDVVSSPQRLAALIPASRWRERYQAYCDSGVPEAIAMGCGSTEGRYWLLDIIEVSLQLGQPLDSVAWVYFSLGESLDLTWLDRQMRAFPAQGHWQVLATLFYRDELDHQLRHLTSSVFRTIRPSSDLGESPEQWLASWRETRQGQLDRWQQMLTDMQAANELDCAVFSVAHGVLRELAAAAS